MLSSVILVLLLLSCTCGENPAIQLILMDKALQYGKHAGAGWVQEKLESVTLPEISGSIDILIGSVDYTISGTKIQRCDFPEPSVEFSRDINGFKASLSGLNMALTGDWRTEFGIIHDGGSFQMAIFNVDILSGIELGSDEDGRLTVRSVHCEAHIQDVHIQIHGGFSWVVQQIVDHYQGLIRGDMESEICPQLEKSIEELELHLQALNVSFDVGEVLSLDLSLSRSPLVNTSTLNLGLKGEFYSIKTHAEPPFEAQPFTMSPQPGYMLSVGLSEFTLNSASYGYFSSGMLQVLINDSMIPPVSPVRLNTTSMGHYIPQLAKMFPDLLMDLLVYAREAPMLSLQPDAGKLSVKGTVKAFAVSPNATQIPLFMLDSDSLFSGKMWIADGSVKGSVTMDNFTLSVAASEIGPFSTDSLENLVRTGMKMVALPKLNKILADGVTLPRMKRAQLVNPVLKMEEGFIAAFSDAEVFLTD
ncbi:unnamed protein product [Ophioblennius macclurei]